MRTVTLAWDPAAGRFEATGRAAGQVVRIGAPRTEAALSAAPEPTGFSAVELLLAGAGACAAWDVVEIARKQRQDLTGLEVRIEGEQSDDAPWEFRTLLLHFTLFGRDLDRRRAKRAVGLSVDRYCAVVATLRGVASVEWRVSFEEVSAEPVA